MPVNVINMIPNSLSGETNRDSEPNVSVNPANPQQIAASAFTPDPASSGTGPIFVSTDGGNTWTLNVVLPGGNRTGDTSLRFATTSNVLYAGILRFDNSNMNILRKANFTAPGAMTVLVNRANEDQPWVEAASVLGGQGTGLDRVYVGHNDFNAAEAKPRRSSCLSMPPRRLRPPVLSPHVSMFAQPAARTARRSETPGIPMARSTECSSGGAARGPAAPSRATW